MFRWLAYVVVAISLAAAVFLNGGAHPQQWQWSALGVSLGAILALLDRQEPNGSSPGDWGPLLLALLVIWMMLQWLPLPSWALKWLASDRWNDIMTARAATGLDRDAWATLSVAPAATLDRLLSVVPAIAAFLASCQMAWWWRDRIWILILPVCAVGFLEGLLGMVQFYWMRVARGKADGATGTYIYHNHFSGLLEMALPLLVFWAVWILRQNATRHHTEALGPALKASALFGMAACTLGGIVASLSRMGFASLITVAILTGLIIQVGGARRSHRARSWLWAIPVGVPVLILLLVLPPNELVARFTEITTEPDMTIDARADIWRDTLKEVAASPWTGVGLGAYEQGLYRYKTTAPVNTVDFAHNDYLQIVAELGVPGAALAGALGAWILFRCYAVVVSRGKSANWEFAVGLSAALLTLGLHSVADFNLYSPANALVLAWLSGVAVSPALKESW